MKEFQPHNARRNFWVRCVNSSGPPWNRMAIPRRLNPGTTAPHGNLILTGRTSTRFLSLAFACNILRHLAAMSHSTSFFYVRISELDLKWCCHWHSWVCLTLAPQWLNKDRRIIIGICTFFPFLHPDLEICNFWKNMETTHISNLDVACFSPSRWRLLVQPEPNDCCNCLTTGTLALAWLDTVAFVPGGKELRHCRCADWGWRGRMIVVLSSICQASNV